MPNQIISRFAPSPTGLLHVGNIRIALLNWLYTRANSGKFILRIDDTDKERSKPHFEEQIRSDLAWLGITWDESFRQSDRQPNYLAAKQQLIEAGRLYPCFETPEELETERQRLKQQGRPPVYGRQALKLTPEQIAKHRSQGFEPYWRFKLDYSSPIIWDDLIRGRIKIDSRSISDPVLFKANGDPTYTICTVADDIDYHITNIVRGDDHLTNSAVQLQIFAALNCDRLPTLAHIPLVYNSEQEISKRIGGFDIKSLRSAEIEPLAIASLLATIGTAATIAPYYTMEELINRVDLKKISRSSVHYDPAELLILNTKYVRNLPYEQVASRLDNPALPPLSREFWEFIRSNISKVSEAAEWWEICHTAPLLSADSNAASDSATATSTDDDAAFLHHAAQLLPLGEPQSTTWDTWIAAIKLQTGRTGKNLFRPLRLALSGREHGPEMAGLLCFMSRHHILCRLTSAAATIISTIH